MARKTEQHQKAASDLAYEKGLPHAIEAEKFVLGSILLNDSVYDQVVEALQLDDFSLESSRRIYARMHDLKARGEHIDRLTVYYELEKQGQTESVGGLAALVGLDEGMPEIANLESYCRAVKEKATLRKTIYAAQQIINRCLIAEDEPKDILADAGTKMAALQVGAETEKDDGRSPEEIVKNFPGGISSFLDPTLRKRGLPTGFHRLDEMLGGGLQDGELIILAARPAVGKAAWH